MTLSESAENLLFLLKNKGAQTAQALATMLDMTSMGARQHLQGLEEQALVISYDSSSGVGRPKRYWKLTDKAQQRFPDTHSYLTVEIISSIQNLFGKEGIERVIKDREKHMLEKYQNALQNCHRLGDKVRKLTQVRTQEGYMAECIRNKDGSYVLIENHCPICAAATQCQQFCSSELQLFQHILGKNVQVKRESHLLSGGRRCTYLISSQDRGDYNETRRK